MNRVAAIQMVSTADVEANLACARELIAEAAGLGAQLIVLPEFFPLLCQDGRAKLGIAEAPGDGPIQSFLSENARRHGIWLVGGTIPLHGPDADHVYNSSLVFNSAGECTARYDKMHLFDVYVDRDREEQYNESATMAPGAEAVVADTPFGKIGLSVCYDLRFPELYRRMCAEGAEIFTAPSAFTDRTGRAHWEMLVRARAVENLCFMIAPGQGGQHNEQRLTWGHTMIVDPWGDILCALQRGPGVACAELDMERLRSLRASFPVLKHRRLD